MIVRINERDGKIYYEDDTNVIKDSLMKIFD